MAHQLDPEAAAEQQKLLTAHRRRLHYRLQQQARLGDHAGPEIALDIEDAQTTIRDLKAALRAQGVLIDDNPVDDAHPVITMRLSDHERRNRAAILQKVRAMWIAGLLDQSLAHETRLVLNLEERPDAVQRPLDAQVQELRRPAQTLSSDITITEVFDRLSGELLILGAPGAGKTTLLLELARDLLDRADHDESYAIPVVLNLSSWATQCRPLAAWLVDELNTSYNVPRKVGQTWVDEDGLLLLLDGLDEVRQEHRTRCVEVINAFRREHGAADLAVCSRLADYQALGIQLKLQGAVCVQPLTDQQIAAYLAQRGDSLAGLRAAFAEDPTLRGLASAPLMLMIMGLAYQGAAAAAVTAQGSAEERHRHLFAIYVERMLARRGADLYTSKPQMLLWLHWLAQNMVREAQSAFFIERLQPEWLATPAARWRYAIFDRLSSAVLVGGAGGLVLGLGGWLVGAPIFGLYGVGLGLLLGGLFGGADDAGLSPADWLKRLCVRALSGWLAVGLIIGLMAPAVVGVIFGLLGALVGALAGGPDVRPRRIVSIEILRWSWVRSARAALIGALVGASGVGFVGGLVGALLGGLAGALAGVVSGGIISNTIETTVWPNQGIWRSASSALRIGLLGGFAAGIATGAGFGAGIWLLHTVGIQRSGALFSGFGFGLGFGPAFGLIVGLFGALVGALIYGGYPCLSHIALRCILWQRGSVPWNYAAFLDCAAERVLLRKVGGGYIFIHRLLLEYFASLDLPERIATTPPDSPGAA